MTTKEVLTIAVAVSTLAMRVPAVLEGPPLEANAEGGVMARTHWDPFTTLARLDQDFDNLVRRTWGASSPTSGAGTAAGYVPAIEMRADGSDVIITLELPGIDVERDVDIEVAEGRLTISGQRRDRADDGDDGGKVLVRELRYGSFVREFALPEAVTADHVDASYDRGLLQVRVREVTRPVLAPQKVAIRSTADRHSIGGQVEDTASQAPA
jgi:HSP20 family protein